jgi:hypothetical protein
VPILIFGVADKSKNSLARARLIRQSMEVEEVIELELRHGITQANFSLCGVGRDYILCNGTVFLARRLNRRRLRKPKA